MAEEEKLFYTIGEVAQFANVKPYVLRYWETEFRKLNPQKSVTGQRAYRKRDIQVALTIKRLLYDEKYTIAGAVKKLDELEAKDSLDQMDMFAVNTPRQEKIGNPAAFSGLSAPAVDPSPQAGERKDEILPPIPKEKLLEMKNLILSTKAILRKYNLV